MKEKIMILILVSFCFTVSRAQLEEKYVKGKIAINDSEILDRYIYIDFARPDLFQNSVSAITEEVYEELKTTGKLKGKNIVRYKPGNISWFELEDGARFTPSKYSDSGSMSLSSIPKSCFMETLGQGKINLYKHYPSTIGFVSGSTAVMNNSELREYVKSHFTLLIIKGAGTPKDIDYVNLSKYVEDNQEVLEKFNSDYYGNLRTVFSKRLKLSAINHADHESDLINLVNDYNK